MEFLLTILINAVAVWAGARLLSGVEVTDFSRAVVIGLVVALLNATIGSFLYWISTPMRWITLGLVGLVVDALVLMIADWLLKGLKIKNFWYALALAVLISLCNSLFHWIFK